MLFEVHLEYMIMKSQMGIIRYHHNRSLETYDHMINIFISSLWCQFLLLILVYHKEHSLIEYADVNKSTLHKYFALYCSTSCIYHTGLTYTGSILNPVFEYLLSSVFIVMEVTTDTGHMVSDDHCKRSSDEACFKKCEEEGNKNM